MSVITASFASQEPQPISQDQFTISQVAASFAKQNGFHSVAFPVHKPDLIHKDGAYYTPTLRVLIKNANPPFGVS